MLFNQETRRYGLSRGLTSESTDLAKQPVLERQVHVQPSKEKGRKTNSLC